LKYGLK